VRKGGPKRRVALAGFFDLDHFGAQIAQDLRRPRRREHARKIENPDV